MGGLKAMDLVRETATLACFVWPMGAAMVRISTFK